MSERVIKGSPLPSDQLTSIAKPRRIIPKEFVRINRPLTEIASAANMQLHHESADSTHKRLTIVAKHDSHMSINKIIEEKTREFETRLNNEKDEAFRNGFEQGRTAGQADKLREIERIEKVFGDAAAAMAAKNDEYLLMTKNLLGRLSLELATAILGEAATNASKETLEFNLQRCLETLKGAGRVKVRINPVDYEFARDNGQIIEHTAKGNFHFEFEPDPSITPGGCHLESSNGTIDGRIESQFEILKDNFLQLV